MRTTVRDVMTTDVVSVREATSFKELAELMTGHQVSALPVVADGMRVVGVVSEADLLHKEEFKQQGFADDYRPELRARLRRRLADRGSGADKAAGSTAAEVMSTPVMTVTPGSTVVTAARLMARYDVKWLPVVDEDSRLLGVVARRDVLSVFVRDDTEIARIVREDLDSRVLGIDRRRIRITVNDGVVALAGDVERRTDRDLLVDLIARIDGVVDVRDEITWKEMDGTTASRPPRAGW